MAATRATRGLCRAEDQDDGAADRDAGKRHVAEIEPIKKTFNGLGEEGRVITCLGDVRVAMPRIVEGIDGEMLGQLRHDLLEQVELCPQRMEQNKRWSLPSLDVTQPVAADLHAVDRDIGIPAELCRWLRHRSQGLDHEGQEPDGHADAGKNNQKPENRVHASTFLGIDVDVAVDLGLAGKDVALSLVLVGEGIFHLHVHGAGSEFHAA